MKRTRKKSSRPVMRALDVLGRRWALRILWELRDGPRTFRTLREACDDVSPSSLNQRLAELRTLGVVERSDDGYALTRPGVRLGQIVLELHRWAEATLRGPRADRSRNGPRTATMRDATRSLRNRVAAH